jgi:hypothetical protein
VSGDAWRRLALLPLPIAVAIGMGALQALRGPYYAWHNLDPSYPYLFGMLNLVNGRPVGIFEHPGIPVQEIGAALLLLAGGFRDAPSLTREVLADPEPYLAFIGAGFLVLLCCALVFLGWAVLVTTRKLWMALLAQSGPLLSPQTMLEDFVPVVSPEPILMSASLLFAGALVLILRGDWPRMRRRDLGLLGGAAALGIATKLPFAPLLVVLPVLLFRRWRAAFIVLLFFCGVAIVLFAPAYSRFLDTIGYAEGLFWSFGSSGQTVIDPARYLRTLQGLILQQWPIAAVCLVAVVTLAAAFRDRRRDDPQRLLLALLVIVFVGVGLLGAKLYQPRYLNGALVLTGLLVAVATEMQARWLERPRHRTAAIVAGIVAAAAIGLGAARDVERRMNGFVANAAASAQLTEILRSSFPQCRVVPYYAATDLTYALKYGFDYARIRDEPYGAILEEIYGPRVFFRIWSREFQTWRAMTTVEEVMARDPCVVLRGSIRGVLDADPKLKALVTDECTLGGETLYVIGRRCQNLDQPRRY